MTLQDLKTALRRALTPPLVVLAALWMFLEEFIWERLAALIARLARLPVIAALEARLARLPPYAAMALFGVPTVLLIPVKLAALYLITAGHALLGIAVLVVAKVAITGVVARLFTVCRPQLMSIGWFARLYGWVQRVRDDLYARVRSMPGWQRGRAVVRLTGVYFRRLKAELGA
ncbi:MAG: hypothetical protein HY060_11540 [Proteobacteria bacterium]|nr:hypothetical protein [Pseudomonadota bacterium]